MADKSVIYETKGRAREYNELAINLFTGCDHLCLYCFGANVTHQTRDKFCKEPKARVTADDIAKSARVWAGRGETRRVLLCFVTDAYQQVEERSSLTRQAIMELHKAGLNVVILTKGGNRSLRDFDILTDKDAYATTLTCTDPYQSLVWEGGAGLPGERMNALKRAFSKGIETWVSLEPVINPEDSMELVRLTHEYTGHYKVGILNYYPLAKEINWYHYGWEMKRLMDKLGVKYYFKKDLLAKMQATPEIFEQTWVCR